MGPQVGQGLRLQACPGIARWDRAQGLRPGMRPAMRPAMHPAMRPRMRPQSLQESPQARSPRDCAQRFFRLHFLLKKPRAQSPGRLMGRPLGGSAGKVCHGILASSQPSTGSSCPKGQVHDQSLLSNRRSRTYSVRRDRGTTSQCCRHQHAPHAR